MFTTSLHLGGLILAIMLTPHPTQSISPQSPMPEPPEPDQLISMEVVGIEVTSNQALAYTIEADRARMDEQTQQIWLDDPLVTIEGKGGPRRIEGRSGYVEPVTIEITDELGVIQEVRKFDWMLRDRVRFRSAQGHQIDAEELRFSNALGTIYSDQPVAYRIPLDQEGGFLYGKAQGMSVSVQGPDSSIGQWTFKGLTHLWTKAKGDTP